MQATTDRTQFHIRQSLAEIAKALGITVGTLKRRILRKAAIDRGYRIPPHERQEAMVGYLISYLLVLNLI